MINVESKLCMLPHAVLHSLSFYPYGYEEKNANMFDVMKPVGAHFINSQVVKLLAHDHRAVSCGRAQVAQAFQHVSYTTLACSIWEGTTALCYANNMPYHKSQFIV